MRYFRKSCPLATCALSLLAQPCFANNFKIDAPSFINKYCVECHDSKKQEGDIRLDTINYDLLDTKTALLWQDIVDTINLGNMPPIKKPRPDKALQDAFLAITQEEINRAAEQSMAHIGMPVRRLSQSAMDNSLEELVGMKLKLTRDLPKDAEVDGFDNLAQTMELSSGFLAQVQTNAQFIADYAMTTQKNPRQSSVYEKNKLGIAKKTSTLGKHKAIFSSQSLKHYGIWPQNFTAPFPGTYTISVDAFGMDNRDQFTKEQIQKAPKVKKLILYPKLPDDALREASIVASLPVPPKGKNKKPSKLIPHVETREVGRFNVSQEEQSYTVSVELLEGEMVSIVYGSAPRQLWPPIAKTPEGDIPVGEALYLSRIAIDGPIQDIWPSKAHTSLLSGAKKTLKASEARRRIKSFADKAFRRPVDEETVDKYLGFYENNRRDLGQQKAMSLVLEAILASPKFLLNYDEGNNDNWALINRLSYFLWNSMPDEKLIALAASGKIRDSAVIKQQARRMLADPKARRFVSDFVGQWLGIKHLGEMPPDGNLFPTYTKSLEESMRQESELYFLTLMYGNLPIKNFVDSNFTLLNEQLAKHYNIEGVKGNKFQMVRLDKDSPRGGILAHASILTATSDGMRTSPVLRGIWVLERMLGTPPNPPPPDVEPLEPDITGATTIREVLAKHREVESCNGCHRSIDPWGFAMENFDPIGNWRNHYGGYRLKIAKGKKINVAKRPIDSTSTMNDGTEISGFKAMKTYLAQKDRRIAKAFTEKLMAYALGYHAGPKERIAINKIVDNNQDKNYPLADLILGICLSEPFINNHKTPQNKIAQH